MKYDKICLKELITIKNGKDHKSLKDGKYPVYGSGGIIRYVEKYLYNKESVLLPRKGTLNNIQFADKPFWTVDTCYYTEVNTEKVVPYFLFRNLRQFDIEALNTGSAVPSMTFDKYYSIQVALPDLEKQQKIVDILKPYDNLIENNQKQIKFLEEAAQRLYKEWFVDLHFPGYEDVEVVDGVPEGWERTIVGKYLRVRSGYAFKSGWWQDTGYPVVKIKDIVNNIVDLSRVDYVAPEHTSKIPEFKLNKGDIVIAMTGATIGKIGLVPEVENLYTNQRVGKVFPNEELVNPTPFVFCFYAQKSILEQIVALSSSSSAQSNISGSQLESFEIVANCETINRFNEIAKQYFDMINSFCKQNCLLVQVRDRLLPKLMSGEIEV